jgi:hypothetical protein
VSVYTNCPTCHNSYPIGRDFDFANRLCWSCAKAKRLADAQEAAKTALADDLVRGVPFESQKGE